MPRIVSSRIALVSLCVWAVAAVAGARQGPPPAPSSESGLVFAPEVRITSVDGSLGELAGWHGGWLRPDGVFLGAGAYALVGGGGGAAMSYGGFVAGFAAPVNDRARIGVRGLVGIGHASLWGPPPPSSDWDACLTSPYLCGTIIISVRTHPNFFVFEPQVTAESRVGRRVSVEVAVGYRVIGSASGYESHLRGTFGSVGVRLGPF
jgi:hypothetical protein